MILVGNTWFSRNDGIAIYRIVNADGTLVCLRSESGPLEGWVDAEDVIPVNEAPDFFTAAIVKEPRDPFLYAARAYIRHDEGKLDLALIDYNRAIQLNGERVWFYLERARLQSARKEYARARADYDEVLVRRPRSVEFKSSIPVIGRRRRSS